MTESVERRLARLEAQVGGDGGGRGHKSRAHDSDDIPPLRSFVEALQIPDRARGGTVPFALYPQQVAALEVLGSADRAVCLKARQVGITTLCLAIALHATQYKPHIEVLLTRQSQGEAQDSIRRLKLMHASIPEELRPQAITEDNAQSLAFGNGSRVDALTSTTSVGRGRSAYLAIVDELAFYLFPTEMMVALEAAAARTFVVSTGNGPTGFFFRLWQLAESGKSAWQQVFLDWRAVPTRDEEWYEQTVEQAIEPRLAKREFPAVPEQAFAIAAGAYFERFDPEVHSADIAPVANWRTVRGVDFGLRTGACVWCQQSPAGQWFVVSELETHNATTKELAAAILQQEATLGLVIAPEVTYADPAGKASNMQTGTPDYEVFAQMGLNPAGHSSNVRDGAMRIMDMLADKELPLIISRRCERLITGMANIAPDRTRPEIPDEHSEFAHILDALRYVAINTETGPVDDWEPSPPTLGPWSGQWGRIW